MARFSLALGMLVLIPITGTAQTPPQLEGTWEVSTLIEDGALVSPSEVQKLFKGGQLVIRDGVLSFTRADDGRVRNLPFVLDAKTSPGSIDVFGSEKTGTKGIYMAQGNTVVVCLPASRTAERPTSFNSGEGYLMFTLRRVATAPPVSKPTTPPPVTLNPPVEPKPDTDASFRQAILGTWGHRDDRMTQTMTFNPDGSFSTARQWKGAFKSLFEGDTRSSGSWKIEDGVIIMTVSASTDKRLRGQVMSYRIQSLTQTEVIYIDSMGDAHREWRVR